MVNISRTFKNILLVLAIVFILVLAILNVKHSPEKRSKEIPETLVVINDTKYDVELESKLILNKIFDYDSLYVRITYMPEPAYIDNIALGAYIVKSPLFENQYVVYMSKDLKISQIDLVLSHELYHLDQYEKGDLEIINVFSGLYRYKQDTILLGLIPYYERPFEKDAYAIEDSIWNELQILLKDYEK